jgi:hypothetical protein
MKRYSIMIQDEDGTTREIETGIGDGTISLWPVAIGFCVWLGAAIEMVARLLIGRVI